MKIQKIVLTALIVVSSVYAVNIQAKDQSILQKAKNWVAGKAELFAAKSEISRMVKEAKELENDPKNIRDQNEPKPILRYWKNPKAESNRFFLTIMRNAQWYEKLGILDDVLDFYFKKTETTPNSILDKCFDSVCDYSFFQLAANDAVYNENARIMFEKLKQRHGDATLITTDPHGRKTSTLDDLEAKRNIYCEGDVFTIKDDKVCLCDSEYDKRNKYRCQRTNEIFVECTKDK